MKSLYLGNGDKQFKFADTTTEIHLTALDNGSAADLTANAKVRIKNDSGYLLEVSANITKNNAVITSGQLAQLPVGSYFLELWDTVNGGTSIYPSDGFLALQINENVTGLSGGLASSVTVDDFIKQFGSLSNQLKHQVYDDVANGLQDAKQDAQQALQDAQSAKKTAESDSKTLTQQVADAKIAITQSQTEASEAASRANDAASDAREAASSANDAATKASTAAENASKQADAAKAGAQTIADQSAAIAANAEALADAQKSFDALDPDTLVTDVGGQKPVGGHINMDAYALKADITTLNNKISSLEAQLSGGLNLELITTETQNMYIDASGKAAHAGHATTSDFIAVDPSKNYTLQYWPDVSKNNNSWIGTTFWDADKAFISYWSGGTSNTPVDYRLITTGGDFVVPSNAAYVRISYYNWNDSTTHIRFNEGSGVALPWDLNPADLLATFYKNNGGTTA